MDGKLMRKPSEQEMHQRRLFVRQLHAAGMHPSEIIEQATQPQRQADGSLAAKFDCSAGSIHSIIAEIREELRRELEVFAPANKAAALQRLYGDLVRLRSELQQLRGLAKKEWGAIRAHAAEVRHLEKLIGEMEGTFAPVKVDAVVSGEVSVNMTRAIGGMTKEQMEEAVREDQQKIRDTRSITTHAESTGTERPAPKALAERGPGPAIPAAAVPGVLDRAPEAPDARRERSSDIAARREVRSPFEQDLGKGPGPGRGISRPVTR